MTHKGELTVKKGLRKTQYKLLSILSPLLLFQIEISAVTSDAQSGKSNPSAEKIPIITDQERREWLDTLKPINAYRGVPRAGLKSVSGGYPLLKINSQAVPLLGSYFGYLFDSYGYTHKPEAFHTVYGEQLCRGGVLDIVQLPIAVNIPGNIDLTRARQISQEILKKNPDTKFILRCQFFPTPYFAKKYPDHLAVFEDGSTNHWIGNPRIRANQPRCTFASRIFERLCAEQVKDLLERLDREPYGPRVFGVFFAMGATGEFNWWYQYDAKKHSIDYSLPMQARFTEFTAGKYHGDRKRLAAAWKDDDADFDHITLPSLKEKGIDIPDSCNGCRFEIPGSIGYFRNPDFPGNQKVCDYFECCNNEMADRLAYLCQVTKKLSDGNLITGGFLGGPLTITGYHTEGSTAFDRVMNSPGIDFIATPWTYEGRELGGNIFFRMPLRSLQLRGKNIWVECDTRTSLARQRQYGGPMDIPGDVQALRRDLIRLATAGAYGYWFEMKVGWYEDPAHLETMKRIIQVSRAATRMNMSSNVGIAVFYDEKSMYYMTEWLNFLLNARMIIQDFGYIGADYDVYSTGDIGKYCFDQYKLCIFPNLAAADSPLREKIDRELKKDGRTILWLYGSGLINPSLTENKASRKNILDLTGFNISWDERFMSAKMKINPDNRTYQLSGEKSYGVFTRPVASMHGATPESPYPLKPIQLLPQFYVNAGHEVKNIASFLDSSHVSFAVRHFDHWTSVWFGSPAVSSDILREIARRAGVHIYLTTDDIVYHNRPFVGIHAVCSGRKDVRLPTSGDVYDMFNNRLIGRNLKEFSVTMDKNETALFYVGDIKVLKQTEMSCNN